MLADLAEQGVDVLRLDGDDDEPGATDRRHVVRGRLGAVAVAQLGELLLAPRGDDHLARLAPARAEQAGEKGLSDSSAAEDGDLALAHGRSLSRPRSRHRNQATAEALEEIDAREAGPLAVRLEQLGRLPGLHGVPSAKRPHEFDEPEVADEAVLEAAETLEADDTRRPRAEAALALDPADDRLGRQVVEPLELEAAAETDDGRAATLVQAEPPQLERRDAPRASRRTAARRGRPRRGGASARITRRSRLRAVFESMSCPQTARSSACATVGVRGGR